MNVNISESWKDILSTEFDKPYFKELAQFVKIEYQTNTVYPPGKDIFAAFDHCSFENLKVLIIGQDPYHGPGQANGLCFSVRPHVKVPPSLRNIFKELKSDIGKEVPTNGDLTYWADQGVLLLNSTLTVREHSPGSHQNRGWEEFTDRVISAVSELKENVVFLLWGAFAQKKGTLIDNNKHKILVSPHPSPFSASRGFLGNRHFSKTNEYLKKYGFDQIKW